MTAAAREAAMPPGTTRPPSPPHRESPSRQANHARPGAATELQAASPAAGSRGAVRLRSPTGRTGGPAIPGSRVRGTVDCCL